MVGAGGDWTAEVEAPILALSEVLECAGSEQPDCLTSAQVRAAQELYRGVHTLEGIRLAPGGAPRGSELQWDGLNRKSIAQTFTEYFAFGEPRPGYRHRDFDVKGLSTQGIFTLMLRDVFVELSIAPKTVHHVSADPVQQVPEELREGQHTVWQFLAAEPMANQNLAIIGPPGSGKTTLLKHMALTLTDKKKRADHGAPHKLPILLFLRNHATTIDENPNYELAEAVHEALQSSKMPAPPPAAGARCRPARR